MKLLYETRSNFLDPTSVMIVSYETLRTLSVYLANCQIGLLLCDEGHRLKNSGFTSINFYFASDLP